MGAERLSPRGASGLLGPYSEAKVVNAAVTGVFGLDLATANVFDLKLTGNATLSFVNPQGSAVAQSLAVIIRQDATGGRTIAWPGSAVWPGGIVPVLSTAANSVDMAVFTTVDGGIAWLGQLVGKAYA